MPAVFPEPLLTGWNDDIELDVNRTGYPVPGEEFKRHLACADAAVINLDDVFDREMIDAAPKLKVLCLFAESTYNIDMEYARSRDITVLTTPGEIYENTADLTFALLMAAARRIPEADQYVRSGKYHMWGPDVLLGGDIYGKTLGIVGLGMIGRRVARRASGFGMRILYSSKHGPKPWAKEELHAEYTDTESLLKESDFVSLHCKLETDTVHIIGRKELSVMKPSAYLINTGRGKLIDEEALAVALENHVIAGAALDVFENEPDVTEKLKSLQNVVLTPHLGASSIDNRTGMAEYAAGQLRNALHCG